MRGGLVVLSHSTPCLLPPPPPPPPPSYMDVGSCVIIAAIFVLHITRLNHQAFVVLTALEVLLLSLRVLYFCMAYEQARGGGLWASVLEAGAAAKPGAGMRV
jgi:hypothetical protein